MPTPGLVVLTREPNDNRVLAERLSRRGIRVLEYPCLETVLIPYAGEPSSRGESWEEVQAVAFTSRRGVPGLMPMAERIRRGGLLLAAVGEGTRQAVQEAFGRPCDTVGDPPTGGGLARMLSRALPPGALVFHACGSLALPDLARGLEAAGVRVWEQVVYETRRPRLEPLALPEPALLVFASPSAVDAFWDANPAHERFAGCLAIGPTTAARLAERGCRAVFLAADPSPEALAVKMETLLFSEDW